jgi:hypothetical protein
MKTPVILFCLIIFISCTNTGINGKEKQLVDLHEKYIKTMQQYNSLLIKLIDEKVLTEKLKKSISTEYKKKILLKSKMDDVIKKLDNEISDKAYSIIKKLRSKIRKLLYKNVKLRVKTVKINNVSRFFENLLINSR